MSLEYAIFFYMNILTMICKNDKKATYTGNEPSPKGLGWCAHAEKVGVKKTGRDGLTWVVDTTSTGVKRWVKAKLKLQTKNISKLQHTDLFDNIDILLKKDKLDESTYKVFRETMNELYDRYDEAKMDAKSLFYTVSNGMESKPKLSVANISFGNERMVIVDPTCSAKPVYVNIKPGIWNVGYHIWVVPTGPNIIVAIHNDYKHQEEFIYEFHQNGFTMESGTIIMMGESLYPNFSSRQERFDWVKKLWSKSDSKHKVDNAYYVHSKMNAGSYHYSLGRVKPGGEIVKVMLHLV